MISLYKEKIMTEDFTKRLEWLKTSHQRQHAIVEALEGEKAPESNIIQAKKQKLLIKDQIAELEMRMQGEYYE